MDLVFRLFGPIQIRVNGEPVRLRGARQERLVAALALGAGRMVTWENLIAAVWETTPPATAKRQIQDLSGLLRRDLIAAGAPGSAFVGSGFGYALEVPRSSIDAYAIQDAMATAVSRRSGDLATSARELRAMLGTWSGEPLAGLDSPVFDVARAGLIEMRLAAIEHCIGAELASGGDPGHVAELCELVRSYPLRERFVALFMHALYQAGRTAEAISAYHQLRRHLDEELAVQPGHAVQDMHRAILRGDGALTAGRPAMETANAPLARRRSVQPAPWTYRLSRVAGWMRSPERVN